MELTAQQVKDIKAINDRIKQIAKTFGTDSKIYDDYVGRMNALFESGINTHAEGYNTLSRGKALQTKEGVDIQQAIESMKALPTVGTLIKRGKAILKRQDIKKPTREEAIVIQMEEMELKAFFDENLQEFYKYKYEINGVDIIGKAVNKMHEESKSLQELKEIRSIYYDYIASGKAKLKEQIFDIESEAYNVEI